MKKLWLTSVMGALSIWSTSTFAAQNCDELKAQIEAKIKAVGVPVYKLTVVGADETAAGKVVGTCDGGKKKIVYWRGTNQ